MRRINDMSRLATIVMPLAMRFMSGLIHLVIIGGLESETLQICSCKFSFARTSRDYRSLRVANYIAMRAYKYNL